MKDLRRQVIRNANELLELITVEMTVWSQMRCTRQRIRSLARTSRQRDRQIQDFQEQIAKDNEKSQTTDAGPAPQPPTKNPGKIIQLEEDLRQLYAERAALLNSRRG
jgi:hypothetical protein